MAYFSAQFAPFNLFDSPCYQTMYVNSLLNANQVERNYEFYSKVCIKIIKGRKIL